MKFKKDNTTQAFWIGAGSFSSFLISIVSAAILSRYLSKSEYGTYKQILYVYNTLLIVFSAGLPQVFSYFLPRYKIEQGKEIVMRISKMLFFLGFLFSIVLYSFSWLIADVLNNPELSKGLKYFSPVPMLMLPSLGIEGIFSTYKKTIYVAVYNTLTRLIMLVLVVLPVILISQNYIYAIYGWILSSIITLVLAGVFKTLPFRGLDKEESNLELREIFKFGIPLLTATIAGTIYRAANQFYVSRYFGTEVFAEFSNGFIEIPFVNMITEAASTVMLPIFSRIMHEKSEISQITNIWRSTLQKSAILIYPIVIFFLFYSEEVVTIIYSDVYSMSSIYFSIAMILNFFNVIVFAPLLLSLGEVKFYARLHYILAILTWVLEFVVIKVFNSPVAVAITFVCVAISGIFVSLLYSRKKLGVSFLSLFPVGRMLVIAAHSFACMFIINWLVRNIFTIESDLLLISISGIGYFISLVITSRLFRINYLEIIVPLLSSRLNKYKE